MERKEILMIALIGVLLLTTGIQTVQLVGLSSAEVVVPTASSAPSSGPSGGGSAAVPTNLQNLPSMVGGC